MIEISGVNAPKFVRAVYSIDGEKRVVCGEAKWVGIFLGQLNGLTIYHINESGSGYEHKLIMQRIKEGFEEGILSVKEFEREEYERVLKLDTPWLLAPLLELEGKIEK